MVGRRLDILHHVGVVQFHTNFTAGVHVFLGVAQFHVALCPVEQRRCDYGIAQRREAVGHVLDVMVHTEDFLHHDHPLGGIGRTGDISTEFKAVSRLQLDCFTHLGPPEFAMLQILEWRG
ncbi:hypothetical protein GALL_543380 [mine drainage metagenome]|uniref:Uncharacterized protein n=1 Tax=mine drainage metagenome TaxID=410659 RepID=A0A1J5P9G8_9ZZZZ